MPMIKDKIVKLLQDAVTQAQQNGIFPPLSLPDVMVERPKDSTRGDYASSFPLKIARAVGMSPLDIARILAGLTSPIAEIARVEAAPPGFVNFSLSEGWLKAQVDGIIAAGNSYGNFDAGGGQRVQIEFVSVNPTGPLHVGHGRGAVLGSTLAGVLAAAGYKVEKEYYVNDAGSQIDAFRRSLWARYRQQFGHPDEIPPDGYHGEYMVDLAREIIGEEGNRFLSLPEAAGVAELGKIGLAKVMTSIEADLGRVGVKFDVWFSEKGLYEGRQYERAMSLLEEKRYVTDRDGAKWFTSSALGEDKDNVLVRSNGTPTYFASDVAYHYNKFIERGFDRVINIWGADHQGHVPRMKTAVGALGIDPQRLEIIITQMVTLKKGGVEVRISKRSGDLVTLREVVDEVGADACRYFFISRSANSQMEFDLELAKTQSSENPVYYVQYAHARIASILRLAQEKSIDYRAGDVSLLTSPEELALIRKMVQFPEVLEIVARNLEPEFLPHFAQELATEFHNFYERCRVISEDDALTAARLKLVAAARIALARALKLMGMSTPEKM